MAHFKHTDVYPFQAASAIGAFAPVKQLGAPSARDGYVTLAASLNDDVIGFTVATVATANGEVAVVFGGVAKAVAAASLGAGARVAVGSSNARLIPLSPSGGPASANLVAVRFAVGRALAAAADGQTFSVLLQPEQLI